MTEHDTSDSKSDETYVDEHGLWIPPDYREDTILIRTPEVAILTQDRDRGEYCDLVDSGHFGDVENPSNYYLLPNQIEIEIVSGKPHRLDVEVRV